MLAITDFQSYMLVVDEDKSLSLAHLHYAKTDGTGLFAALGRPHVLLAAEKVGVSDFVLITLHPLIDGLGSVRNDSSST